MVPGFSEGDKVAPHGWVLLSPAALQGLLPAAKALLAKQKILPAPWPVTPRGAALCQCGLTSSLNGKSYVEQGALLPIKAVPVEWALPVVSLRSSVGLC